EVAGLDPVGDDRGHRGVEVLVEIGPDLGELRLAGAEQVELLPGHPGGGERSRSSPCKSSPSWGRPSSLGRQRSRKAESRCGASLPACCSSRWLSTLERRWEEVGTSGKSWSLGREWLGER